MGIDCGVWGGLWGCGEVVNGEGVGRLVGVGRIVGVWGGLWGVRRIVGCGGDCGGWIVGCGKRKRRSVRGSFR